MHARDFRPSKKIVFWGLMGLSSLTIMFPPRISDGVKHGTQLLVPLQDVVYRLTFQGARALDRINDTGGPERREIQALQNELAAAAGEIEQLETKNLELAAIRSKSIPRALLAQVVARDIVEWRDSLLIERGSKGRGASPSIGPQDWVASRLFINEGLQSDVQEGQAVIGREVLLGRIEQVSPFMSRVCLFTDVNSPPIRVRIGAVEDGRFVSVDYACSLQGRGRGRMIIKNVDYRHVEKDPRTNADVAAGETHDTPILPDRQRGVRVGDFVYSAPGQLGLPIPMVIGRVTEIVEDPTRRLVYDVIVEPTVKLDEIRTVSVIPLIPANVAMD